MRPIKKRVPNQRHSNALARFFNKILKRDSTPESQAAADVLTPAMRLSELVEQYYKPLYLVARDARPRTLESVEISVRYWVEYTGDPPLEKINQWHAGRFLAGLKRRPGLDGGTLANNTVRKHCGAIQAILDLCGPAERRNRCGLDLLQRVPYIARPALELKPAEDYFTLQEAEQLLAACSTANLPKHLGCSAGTYLGRIYVLIFNTGMRIGGIMGATWPNFHGDWLWLPPRVAAKGTRGQRIELNAQSQEVIEAQRGQHPDRIFCWPLLWPESKRSLYIQHSIVRKCLPPNRRFGFHALRKLHTNELAEINALAVQKSLGHSTARVTVEHYLSRKVVAAAVAKLPTLGVRDVISEVG